MFTNMYLSKVINVNQHKFYIIISYKIFYTYFKNAIHSLANSYNNNHISFNMYFTIL